MYILVIKCPKYDQRVGFCHKELCYRRAAVGAFVLDLLYWSYGFAHNHMEQKKMQKGYDRNKPKPHTEKWHAKKWYATIPKTFYHYLGNCSSTILQSKASAIWRNCIYMVPLGSTAQRRRHTSIVLWNTVLRLGDTQNLFGATFSPKETGKVHVQTPKGEWLSADDLKMCC